MPTPSQNNEDWIFRLSTRLSELGGKIDNFLPPGSRMRKLALISLITLVIGYAFATTPKLAPIRGAELYTWQKPCNLKHYQNPIEYNDTFGITRQILSCSCFQKRYKIHDPYNKHGLFMGKGSEGYYRIYNDAVQLRLLKGKERWSPVCSIARVQENFFIPLP